MENDEKNGVSMPQLNLLDGVRPDTLSKLMTSVLLRKAYCETHPWAQWLLLASLEILHGHAVPRLDSKSLHVLQGIEEEGSPFHVEGTESNLRRDSTEASSYCNIDYQNAAKMRKLSHDGEEDFASMDSSKNDEHTLADIVSDNIDLGQKLEMPKRELNENKAFAYKDFGVQVNPRIMRRTCNKWVQVKKCPQITQGTQTKDSFWNVKNVSEEKDSLTQIEPKGSHGNRVTNDKETQRSIISMKKTSVQCSSESCHSKSNWKLIPISGLPKKKNGSYKMQENGELKEFSIYPLANCEPGLPRKPLVDNALDPQGITDPTKLVFDDTGGETPLNIDICFFNPMFNTCILLFHGRPLIRSKSVKDAAAIPLDKLNGMASIMLEDPREKEF